MGRCRSALDLLVLDPNEMAFGFTDSSGGVFCLLGGTGEAAAAGKPHPGGLRQRKDC